MRRVLAVALLVLLSVPPATAGHVEDGEIRDVLPKDAIPAITDPTFTKQPDLADDAPVLGVEVAGDARAYPLKIMNWHEIVDDTVGGEPLAVTYCPLCRTGLVFERTVDGETLTFKVSGKLLRNNLLMYDTKTGSLWAQAWGQAVEGPMHGTELALVSSRTTTFGTWREAHPDTLVMEEPEGHGRDYDRDPYAGYDERPDTLFDTRYEIPDVLHPKALVLGLEQDGQAVAWSFELVREEGVVDGHIGDRDVVVTFDGGSVQAFDAGGRDLAAAGNGTMVDDRGRRYDRFTGRALDGGHDLEPIPADTPFWFSWYEFHPETTLFHTDGRHAFSAPIELFGDLDLQTLLLYGGVVAAVAAGVFIYWTDFH